MNYKTIYNKRTKSLACIYRSLPANDVLIKNIVIKHQEVKKCTAHVSRPNPLCRNRAHFFAIALNMCSE